MNDDYSWLLLLCVWLTLRHNDAFEFMLDLIMNWNCDSLTLVRFHFIQSSFHIHSHTYNKSSPFQCFWPQWATNWEYYVLQTESNVKKIWATIKTSAQVMIEVISKYIDSNDRVFNKVDRATITWCNKNARQILNCIQFK